jgi:protease-4
MTHRRDLIVLLFFILIFFLFLYLLFGTISAPDSFGNLDLKSGEKIALVRLIGPIYNARPILDQLDEIEDATGVKAVVFRLETPGGAVAASQEIYEKLVYLRDEIEIPIVATMGNVAASGGYYIALGCDTIIANPGTVTGSIGVVMIFPQYYKLFDKIGISQNVIKSGKFKDSGSPYKELTREERAYFQQFIDDGYDQFIEAVAAERDLPLDEVKQIADGRVFTGRQAEELGLIDVIGTLDDAIRIATDLGGIEGDPRIIEMERKRKLTLLDLLLDDLGELIYQQLGLNSPFRYELPL